MTVILRARDTNGWQDFGESDFPVPVDVSSEDSVVFGTDAESDPAAWLGISNGLVFLQPEGGAISARLNGKIIDASVWLADGDEIQIAGAKIGVKIYSGVVTLSLEIPASAPILTPPDTPPVSRKQTEDVYTPSVKEGSRETQVTEDDQARDQFKTPTNRSFKPLPAKKARPLLRNMIVVFFLLLLFCVIFVLIAVPVRIEITPPPDIFSLSRFPLSVKIGERYLVLPGTYQVIAKKAGYRDFEESLQIRLGSDSTFDYEMIKVPGMLDVVSEPAGAQVLIDGNVIGETPLSSVELQAGDYELSVVTQRYLPNVQTVEIQGMAVHQSVKVTLQPGWGTLRIESEPNGAEVWLNGLKAGQTPLYTEPMAGAYQVELRKSGWKPVLGNIKIEPGETIEMARFELEKEDGMIEITSKPSGASVMLNGEFRGHTPMSLAIMPEKNHSLILAKSGFENASRRISVDRGGTHNVDISLKPEYGTVFITSQPADAELAIDGKIMGTASRRLRLTTVPHRIEVSKAGYEPFATTLTPIAGVSKKLDIQLKSQVKNEVEATPVDIKTGEGQVLRRVLLTIPVRFEMGASRREPGRRSNETQYLVELTRTFYISETEVTNAAFQRFQPGHNSGSADGFDLNEMDQPVTSVSWNDAAAYLNWLSEKDGLPPAYIEKDGTMVAQVPITTGYRLPTEAEWAFVARYEGGKRADKQPLKYPWGSDRYPLEKSGNYADSSARGALPLTIKGYSDCFRVAAPVGKFPPNAAGIFDLGGNVSEWCHDYYDVYSGSKTKVLRNPTGPNTGTYHVVRGASWRHGSITELRFSYRDYSDKPRDDIGFRIARYAKNHTKE